MEPIKIILTFDENLTGKEFGAFEKEFLKFASNKWQITDVEVKVPVRLSEVKK